MQVIWLIEIQRQWALLSRGSVLSDLHSFNGERAIALRFRRKNFKEASQSILITSLRSVEALSFNNDDESTKMQQIIFHECNSNIENSQLVYLVALLLRARPFEEFFFFVHKQVAKLL